MGGVCAGGVGWRGGVGVGQVDDTHLLRSVLDDVLRDGVPTPFSIE